MNDRRDEGSAAQTGARLANWQKLLLVLSVLVMVAGGALMVLSAARGGSGAEPGAGGAGTGGGDASDLVRSFEFGGASSGGEAGAGDAGEASGSWSPTVFRLGFGFFAGFCLGYVFRTFLKLSILVIGTLLLLGFGLQYAGIVDVDWSKVSTIYDKSLAWIQSEMDSFTQFVQGYLPSAASGAAGMFVGFRKK